MDDIKPYIQKILDCKPLKIIISKPADKDFVPKKITVVRVGGNGGYFQAENIVNNQAFHENIKEAELALYINLKLSGKYLRLNAFCGDCELVIAISKKGKAAFSRVKNQTAVNVKEQHNREKSCIFKEGTLIEPLIDMGIFSKDGYIVSAMYDKYRQINRFIEVIGEAVPDSIKELNIVDFGCGKGYLTFLLYYYLVEIRKIKAHIVGLDLKEAVVDNCNKTAVKYGYESLSFICRDIKNYKPDFNVDMVISLHACDTATDYALYNAVKWGAKMIFAVPCCQHEVNSQIKSEKLSLLTRYGVIREQVASSVTDALRGSLITYCGYRVQLLDVVSPVHTPKNIMIRAVKASLSDEKKQEALNEVLEVTGEFNLKPALYRLLFEN